jgi:hypothetical protein
MGSLDDDLVGYTLPIDTLGRCQTDSMHYWVIPSNTR